MSKSMQTNRYWPEYLPKEIIFEYGKVPVFEYLRKHAEKTPDKAAIIFYGTVITYKQLDDYSDRFATYLYQQGLRKGDRVSLFLSNSPQYIIAMMGVEKMGGIVVPTNPLFKELELKYQINDCGAKGMVFAQQMAPIVEHVKNNGDLSTVEVFLSTHYSDLLPEEPVMDPLPYMVTPKFTPEWSVDFMETVLATPATPPVVEIDMYNDLAMFEYTGGSTGLPKGAMLTHIGHLVKPLGFMQTQCLTRESIEVTMMPYFNMAGCVFMMTVLLAGATNVMITQFEPVTTLKAVQEFKATHIYTPVPSNLAMMDHPDFDKYDLSSLKLAYCTSFVVSLNAEIAARWKEATHGCPLVEAAYGLSETHTGDTLMPINRPKYGSCGIPNYDTEIKILDLNDKTKEMPVGEQGEIAVRNLGCMKGYWNKPEATAATLMDGFVLTGDIGKFDEDGYLYWLGRFKEMIKVSGFSVFPEEVEAMINQHEAVLETAVIPVDDERKGQVVKAFVVLKPGYAGKITSEELRQWAKSNMTPHKVPALIEFRESLPKQGVKLLRRLLIDEEKSRTSNR